MTNAPVTNSVSYFKNVTSKRTGGGKQNALQQDFTQVIGKATYEQTKPKAADGNDKKTADAGYREDTKPNAVREKVDQSSKTKAEAKAKAGRAETVTDKDKAITEKGEKLIGEVAEELNVSEEEVRAAMEALGMQVMDLLNPDRMAQLVAGISGETDGMSLVMNEELYGNLQNLLQSVEAALQELQQELAATPEELQNIMADMRAAQNTKELLAAEGMNKPEADTQATDSKAADNIQTAGSQTAADTAAKAETEVMVTVTGREETSAKDKTDRKAEVQNAAVPTEEAEGDGEGKQIVLAEETAESEQTDKKQQPGKAASGQTADIEKPMEALKGQNTAPENNNKKESGSESSQSFLQNYINKAMEATKNVLQTTLPPETADAESIMKQMMDMIKLHAGTTITEMEIQLQPANLGTINLQVAMKNGMVTAQITAETEAVKKAIESQIVQLRENLNEQGIKIEAVEVTIASHAFERNLNQGQQSSQSEDAQTAKETGRKRIMLEELDAEAEAALEETDKIQVQMMKQNGNTVNLTA